MSDNDDLIQLEHERCEAISNGDLKTLDRLLSEDLSHTHVTGETDDRAGYLKGLTERPRRTTRQDDLTVRIYGDVAVMTGALRNVIPATADREAVTMTGHALQVWVRSGSSWQQVAFAASARLPAGV